MSKELVTPGSPIVWQYLDRTFGGRAVNLAVVSDGLDGNAAGSIHFTTPVDVSGSPLTRNGLPVLAGSPFVVSAYTGAAAPGSVVLAGAVVGDLVSGVVNLTTGAPDTTHFENAITVAGHIQQKSGSGDLSADKFMVVLTHQS